MTFGIFFLEFIDILVVLWQEKETSSYQQDFLNYTRKTWNE
jgi:hypothetical protein